MLIQLKFTKGSAEQIIYFFIEVRDFRKVGNHWVKAPTYGPSLYSFVGKCQRQKLGKQTSCVMYQMRAGVLDCV